MILGAIKTEIYMGLKTQRRENHFGQNLLIVNFHSLSDKLCGARISELRCDFGAMSFPFLM